MRVVTPKVHVEVFRPINTTKEEKRRIDPEASPLQLVYHRRVNIDDRRVKGIKLEETALFGGFVEINVAEDPQSEVFDLFQPNDHVEIFYEDADSLQSKQAIPFFSEEVKISFNTNDNIDMTDSLPKFAGSSWKSDLFYTPTMVTTKLHAWDYLRIMQYYNIPRGEGKGSRLTFVDRAKNGNKIITKDAKYKNDFLDYVDRVLSDMISMADERTIFGQKKTFIDLDARYDSTETGTTRKSIGFSEIGKEGSATAINLEVAGIGSYCHRRVKETVEEGSNREDLSGLRVNSFWQTRGFHLSDNLADVEDAMQSDIDNMSPGDIKMYRFIDGTFQFATGLSEETGEFVSADSSTDITADIVVIDQFALMYLLLAGLTYHHNLTQWFTPILSLPPDFTELVDSFNSLDGTQTGTSKLVYIRIKKDGRLYVNFNKDSFSEFMKRFGEDLIKITLANLKRSFDDGSTEFFAPPDIMSLVFMNTDFPQPAPSGDTFSIVDLYNRSINQRTAVTSQKDMMEQLVGLFIDDDTTSADLKGDMKRFYDTFTERISTFATFMRIAMNFDDSIVSLIMNMPSSYMRADIYTGSKFMTFPYDSLSITRILQILASTMKGFPATNNPVTNTNEGILDSYPIFAANRMVIKTRAMFGRYLPGDTRRDGRTTIYDIFPSLSKAYKEFGQNNQVKAVCFMVIEIGFKKLVTEDEVEFVIPLEDVQDFGIIKASTVNHHFNFALGAEFANTNVLDQAQDSNRFIKKTVQEGFSIEYQESGVDQFGFSPPEHQQLTITDLTQSDTYSSVEARRVPVIPNDNDDIVSTTMTRADLPDTQIKVTDFDEKKVILCDLESAPGDTIKFPIGTSNNKAYISKMFQSVTDYVDISDIQNEFKVLQRIINGELGYKDITNVAQELMDNIRIRPIFRFSIDLEADAFEDRIDFTDYRRDPETGVYTSDYRPTLKTYVNYIVEQLEDINRDEMQWLFPVSGRYWDLETQSPQPTDFNAFSRGDGNSTVLKHLFFVSYLDLLVKGIRYLLWSIAKARIFAHTYLPIEYSEYAARSFEGDVTTRASVIEPGSSIIFTIDDRNSLYKSIDPPLVPFKIEGLQNEGFKPLIQSIRRERVERPGQFIKETGNTKERTLIWYVSKKETYLGADGAMMRLEMTEGSLDWTLFYNEKNLLTQISEHYLLNGLPNFKT